MPITVVTAIFGGYEMPKAPPTKGVDRAVLFTDSTEDSRWEIHKRRAAHGLSNLRHFFVAKQTPHICVTDDDDVLWIDGSFEPKEGADVREMFEMVPKGGIGLYRHPDRQCYTDEARFSQWYGAEHERAALCLEQSAYYEKRGCPLRGGLWNSGIIVWRGAQRRLGERWFAETMAWSASDQMALPYVLHALGLGVDAITVIPGNIYECAWFDHIRHGCAGRTTPK